MKVVLTSVVGLTGVTLTCAGVWPASPRFLVWRGAGRTLELAISETPAIGWLVFGPFGSGAVFLRAALVRLLWYALYPASGSPPPQIHRPTRARKGC